MGIECVACGGSSGALRDVRRLQRHVHPACVNEQRRDLGPLPTLARLRIPPLDVSRLWDEVSERALRPSSEGWGPISLGPDTPGLEEIEEAIPGQRIRRLLWVMQPGHERETHIDANNGSTHMGPCESEVMPIHVPLFTSKDATHWGEGTGRVHMAQGTAWWLNISQPHSARNFGTETRVHLLLDTYATPWLRAAAGLTNGGTDG